MSGACGPLTRLEDAPDTLVGSDGALATNLNVKETIGYDDEGKPVYQGLVLVYSRELSWRRRDV